VVATTRRFTGSSSAMRRPSLRRRIEAGWYDRAARPWLAPLAWLYGLVTVLRRRWHTAGSGHHARLPVPVVIVGNVTVGGTGKTPVVGWVAELARARGFRPGIVARGYGGSVGRGPRLVAPDDTAELVGDEALLHVRAGVPVAVGSDRPAAARLVVERGCDLVIADDGLQHLALARDRTIVVVDGARAGGNGSLLPAGPLREPWSRLAAADVVLVNGPERRNPPVVWPAGARPLRFDLAGDEAVDFAGRRRLPLTAFAGRAVAVLAGIGNPQRFLGLLAAAGLRPALLAADDHGRVTAADLQEVADQPLFLTAKDAVKYGAADQPRGAEWWVVPVRLVPSAEALAAVATLLDNLLPPGRRGGASPS
jgi:tetraacyldisaccharide 4'-kinase